MEMIEVLGYVIFLKIKRDADQYCIPPKKYNSRYYIQQKLNQHFTKDIVQSHCHRLFPVRTVPLRTHPPFEHNPDPL